MKLNCFQGLIALSVLIAGCEKSPETRNDDAPQLTAQELASLLDFHVWKLQISEIPTDRNRLRLVVMDDKGTILDHGGTAWLDGTKGGRTPLDLTIGMKIEGREISVKCRYQGSGQSFKLDHFVEDASSPNAGHLCKSSGQHWNGDFLHLLGNSRSMGFGPEPFPGATRIVALQFWNEAN